MRRLSSKLSCTLLLLLCSCGTMQLYPGPKRSPSEVARLQPGGHLFRAVSIHSVDGHSLGFGKRYAEVIPGKHRVMVQLTQANGNVTRVIQREVTFETRAGQTYTVEAQEKGFWNTTFWAWIEDAVGQVVGGEKPS